MSFRATGKNPAKVMSSSTQSSSSVKWMDHLSTTNRRWSSQSHHQQKVVTGMFKKQVTAEGASRARLFGDPAAEPEDDDTSTLLETMRKLLHEHLLDEKVRTIMHSVLTDMNQQMFVSANTDLIDSMQLRMKNLEALLGSTENDLHSSLEKRHQLAEEVEAMKCQQSVASTGSFEDGGPSPSIMRTALTSVQNELFTCASNLSVEAKKRLKVQRLSNSGGKAGEAVTSMQPPPNFCRLFQRQLCDTFFTGFETISFNNTLQDVLGSCTFEKPKQRRARLFKEFNEYRDTDEQVIFKDKTLPLRAFVYGKSRMFADSMEAAPFADAAQRTSLLEGMFKDEECPLTVDFIALGTGVWLLHKLVFSFDPIAEIFHVKSNSLFDSEYMQDMEEEGEGTKNRPQARVEFMAAPGFTLRGHIYKAQVCISDASENASSSATTAMCSEGARNCGTSGMLPCRCTY